MSAWIRIFVTVPVALQEEANAQAEALDFDGGAETFDVPLGPDAEGEPTDYGASTLARPHTVQAIEEQLLPAFPGARVYRADQGWTWQSAMADAGLTVLTGEA